MKTNKITLVLLLILLAFQLPIEKGGRALQNITVISIDNGRSTLSSMGSLSNVNGNSFDNVFATQGSGNDCAQNGKTQRTCSFSAKNKKTYKVDKKKQKIEKNHIYRVEISEQTGGKGLTDADSKLSGTILDGFNGTNRTLKDSTKKSALSVKVFLVREEDGQRVYCPDCGTAVTFDVTGILDDSRQILAKVQAGAKLIMAADFKAKDKEISDAKKIKLAEKKNRICLKDLDSDGMEKSWDSKEEQQECYQARLEDEDDLDLTDKEKRILWARLSKSLRKGLKSNDWDKVEEARERVESLADADISLGISNSIRSMQRAGEYREFLNNATESIDSMGGVRNPWTYQAQQQLSHYESSLGQSFQGREGRHWARYLQGQFSVARRNPGRYLKRNGFENDRDLFGSDLYDRNDIFGGNLSFYGQNDFLGGSSLFGRDGRYRDRLSRFDRGYEDDFLLNPLQTRRRDSFRDDYLMDDYYDDPLGLSGRGRRSIFSNGLFGRSRLGSRIGQLGRSNRGRSSFGRSNRRRSSLFRDGYRGRRSRYGNSLGRSSLGRSSLFRDSSRRRRRL